MDREFISVSIYHIMMKKNETIHSGHEAIDNSKNTQTRLRDAIATSFNLSKLNNRQIIANTSRVMPMYCRMIYNLKVYRQGLLGRKHPFRDM